MDDGAKHDWRETFGNGAEAVNLRDFRLWFEEEDIFWRLRTAPLRILRVAWRRLRRGQDLVAPPQPRRAVPSRFVAARRDGTDLWLDTHLPSRMIFPVFVGGALASYIGDGAPAPREAPRFAHRVFSLFRVTRADHLGPTEAEYREEAPDAL